MKIRFLQTTSSAAPGYPFQVGQVVEFQKAPADVKAWIAEGRAELVQDEPELATMESGERAVLRRGSRRG